MNGAKAAVLLGALVAVAAASGAGAVASGNANVACDSLSLVRGSSTRFVSTPLPARVLAQYAVLRRAQTADDRLPTPVAFGLLDRLEAPYVRLLYKFGSHRFYLIPGYNKPVVPPARCLQELSGPAQRRIRQQARRAAHTLLLCFDDETPTGSEGGCDGFDAHHTSDGWAATGERSIASPAHPETLSALIPDGVARVVARYKTGQRFDVAVVGNLQRSKARARTSAASTS